MSQPLHVGQRLSYDGAICTVRYIGQVAGTTGTWLGVEWDDPLRGKHHGVHGGSRYFTCVSNSPTAASFVRPTRKSEEPRSFITALNDKYVVGVEDNSTKGIYFSGKIAEEVGFDKIRRQQAQVEELRIVILDGMCITTARNEGEKRINDVCPSIRKLDLSRNLFEHLAPVIDVCRELPELRRLCINGNRFQGIMEDDFVDDISTSCEGVTELELEDTLAGWDGVCRVAGSCPSLTSLIAGSNQFSTLPPVQYATSLTSNLTSLKLEFNEFTALSDLASLTGLTALRDLHLKGNNIISLSREDGPPAPVFPPSVHYLDLSYNQVKDWAFVDALPTHLPGLRGLRLTHNPIYGALVDDGDGSSNKTSSTEDAHMFTIARLAPLKSLNFTAIAPSDRANAEMFYLSRIAKQLAAVPESAEDTVKAQHPRYEELCEIYGEPDIIRRNEVNPSFLESRLVTVAFQRQGHGKKTAKIPRSFDVYAVKGIAGRMFDLPPLGLRLIWETGEWDPVAGVYDEEDEDELDDADLEVPGDEVELEEDESGSGNKPGRWIKREVELKDGPRQLGYCVDGLDATIRVEEK